MDPTQIISVGSQVLPVAKKAIENLSNASNAFARELLGVGNPSTSRSAIKETGSEPVSFQLKYQQVVQQIQGALQHAGLPSGTKIEIKVGSDGRVEVLNPAQLSETISNVINSNDSLVDNLNSLKEKHENFLWRHPGPASFQSPLLRGVSSEGLRIPLEV